DRYEGQPLKGVEFRFGAHAIRGEAIVTRSGIEGGAVYALSAELRAAIAASGETILHVALRPDLAPNELPCGCLYRAESNRSPIFCARRLICRRSRSAWCRRRRSLPAVRRSCSRQKTSPN